MNFQVDISSGYLIQQQQPCFWLFKVCNSSMQIHSQTGLQPDVPRRHPPPSYTPWPHMPQLHGHVAAPVAPSWLHRHPLQPHRPWCCMPCSCTATLPPSPLPAALTTSLRAQLHGHGAASLAAARTSQLGWPCCPLSLSRAGHIAAHLQLDGPCCPLPHSQACHVAGAS